MYIPRILNKKLKQAATEFAVVAVTGPRQSGKSTLVKKTFPKKQYVTLEDVDTRKFAIRDPRGFLERYREGAIFDEVQRAPDLFSYIQGVVDTDKKMGQFILTGSESFVLHEKISQSLAGRVIMLELYPLSLEELSAVKKVDGDYLEYIFKGFYPSLYERSVSIQDWYSSYLRTYVERDVRLMKNISDLDTFQTFMRLCAGRTAQLLNLSSLGNDVGITHNTAKSWMNILVASGIVVLLQPHHQNFRKRMVKSPKLYFFDTGLACSLLGIEHVNQLQTHPSRGALFESMIISEIIKLRTHRGLRPHSYFWRDKTGHEIDCILDHAGDLYAIEIKSGKTINDDFFKNLTYWRNLSNTDEDHAFLVYGGSKSQKRTYGTVVGWQQVPSVDSFVSPTN